jgi:hypothetical protein
MPEKEEEEKKKKEDEEVPFVTDTNSKFSLSMVCCFGDN